MEGFVARKPPSSARIGSIAIAFVILLALGLVYFRLNRQPQVEPEGPPAPPPAAKKSVESRARAEAPKVTASQPETPRAASDSSEGAMVADVRPSPAEVKVNEPSSTQIEFDLVSKDLMGRLSQESDSPLDVGRYTIAVVPQFKNKYDAVKGDAGFKQLAVESRNLAMGQPSLVFRGGKEPKSNETIGFWVELTPSRNTERGVEYKISIKRSLPDITSSGDFKVNTQSFEETITIPPESAVIFAGLLPRKQIVDGEDELYKGNVMSPFLEPAFEKGDEEFLIIVNPHFNQTSN